MLSLEHYIQILESVLDSRHKIVPLVPVTSQVSFGSEVSERRYLRPDNFSAIPVKNLSGDFEAISARLLEELRSKKSRIQDLEQKAYADTLFYLIAGYCSRFGVVDQEGVSLFDYIRIQAATASSSASNTSKPFLLVKGDISGIQNFIYHTSDSASGEAVEGKNKAKRLRGRSFYISLLTDAIADAIIHKLGLQEANILYAGGGHFSLLAPNEQMVINAIDDIRIEINEFFREKFQLRMTLVLESIEAPVDIVDNYSEVYNQLERKIFKAKKQKAWSILDSFDKTFDRRTYHEDELDEEFRRIGELLTKNCLLIEMFDEDHVDIDPEDGIALVFKGLGIQCVLLKRREAISSLGRYLQDRRVRIFTFGEPKSFLDPLEDARQAGLNNAAYGFKFFGLYAPRHGQGSKICDFETLSKLGKGEQLLNYPLLSIMRADIDNLGAIFSFGLEDKNGKTSIYRVVSLSRELILFFCYHINMMAEKHKCYITYSGGDDAFIVGSWINVLEFSKSLHGDFESFSCGNSTLTLSAGILHCNSHYPIQKAGAEAGELESSAKNYAFGDSLQDKNAVNVFDSIVRWDTLKKQLEFADKFLGLFEPTKQHYTRSMLHHVLFQIRDAICENGDIDLSKLHQLSTRLTWLFAKSPHKITKNKLEQYDKEQLEGIEKLKVEFAKRLIEEKTVDMVKNYSIITSYILLITRKSRD